MPVHEIELEDVTGFSLWQCKFDLAITLGIMKGPQSCELR